MTKIDRSPRCHNVKPAGDPMTRAANDLPTPNTIARLLENCRRDLDWLTNTRTGHTPYTWAYETLDPLRSPIYPNRRTNEPSDPTAATGTQLNVDALTRAATRLEIAQTALAAARHDLQTTNRREPAGEGPRGRFIPQAEYEALKAYKAKRDARRTLH